MRKEDFIQSKYDLYINGEWREASDKKTLVTTSPADGSILATIAEATDEDVNLAINSAWAAFKTWKNVDVKERARILLKIADIIEENTEDRKSVV